MSRRPALTEAPAIANSAVGQSWPRGLRREAAATYVGVGITKFDEMVTSGLMPKPQLVAGCVVWDRVKLDAAFDNLPDQESKMDRGRWKSVAV
jgi:hypothetical protein